jgi:hypothetical protein
MCQEMWPLQLTANKEMGTSILQLQGTDSTNNWDELGFTRVSW